MDERMTSTEDRSEELHAERLEADDIESHSPEAEEPSEVQDATDEERPEQAHLADASTDPLTAHEETQQSFDADALDGDAAEATIDESLGQEIPIAAEEAAMTIETAEEPETEVAAEAETTEVAADASSDDEEEEEDEEFGYMFQLGEWYVVHTYAGYENKVKANLASRIQSMNMEDKIYEVVVPTEEVMELKAGKMQSVQKKVFPGYILVRMELDDDSWYVVRNTPGVTGFVGPTGAKPVPLDPTEVAGILAPKAEERPRPQLEFEQGEVVSVVGGAFNGYSGPVSTIDQDKQRVTVLLDLFGRETPVELTFEQVTKL
jgi:transcriptional antiterminator NusG